MKNLHSILLAALLLAGAAGSTTQAANAPASRTVVSSPTDTRAGKQYGQQYAAQTAEQYGYGTPTYYSQIENEYNYAETQKTDPNSPQPADFWRGVQLGVYSN